MKKIVLSTILMLGLQCMAQNTVPEGAINGLFTINSNGDHVYFSKGNLQYIGSEDQPYWKFADSQWEYLGENGQGSNSHNVNRDLFGWGTSGYKHGAGCFKPWSTSTNWSDYYAYGHPDYHLYSKTGQADWGYNAISNGGNMEKSGWRTLSEEEWNYIFNTRNTPSGIRFTKGKVNNIDGVILLPDDWDASYQFLQRINFAGDIGFKVNTFTASEWSVMESHGAVFCQLLVIVKDGILLKALDYKAAIGLHRVQVQDMHMLCLLAITVFVQKKVKIVAIRDTPFV